MHTDDDIFESLDIHSEGEPPAPSVPSVEAFDADEFMHPDLSDDDDIFEDLDMEDKIFSAGVSGSSGRAAGSASGAGASKAGASKLSGRSVSDSRSGAAAGKAGGAAGKNGKGRSAASPREFNTVESSLDSRKISREKAQKKKSRIRRIILWTVVEAITLCAIFVYGYVLRNWNLIARPEVKLEAIENHNISLDKKKEMEGFWNIAVFGVDGRSSDVVGRGLNSDVILVASINKDTGEIRLVSVFRDTYLNISDGNSYNKINQAYAIGGPEQALAALNKNLDLNIQNYVTFNWKAVADGINILGGVDNIPISKAELYYINAYITETVKATGIGSVQLKNTGEQHLDGVQAVAYGRLRYMDNDFARTERQRRIIKACFEKARKANFSVLNNIMVVCFPQCATNIGFNEIIAMAQNIGDYSITETGGFPWQRGDAIIGKKGDVVVPATLESNVRYLHEFLFGDANYTPSDAVLRYSQKIKEDSNYYKEAKFIESVATDGGVIQKPRAAAGGSGGSGGSSRRDEEDEEEEEMTLGIDENGSYIYPTDEDGNIVIPTDEDGNILYPTDEDGNIIKETTIRPTDVLDEENGDGVPGGPGGTLNGEGDPDETDEPAYGPGGGTRPAGNTNTDPTRETTNTDHGDEPVISPAITDRTGETTPGGSSTTPGGSSTAPGSSSTGPNGSGSTGSSGTGSSGSTTADTPGGDNISAGGPGGSSANAPSGADSSSGSGSVSGSTGPDGSSSAGPGSSSTGSSDTSMAPGGSSSASPAGTTTPGGAVIQDSSSTGPGSSGGSSGGSGSAPGEASAGPGSSEGPGAGSSGSGSGSAPGGDSVVSDGPG